MIDFKGHRFETDIILKEGQTIDFLLTAHRDKQAALRFFKWEFSTNGHMVDVFLLGDVDV